MQLGSILFISNDEHFLSAVFPGIPVAVHAVLLDPHGGVFFPFGSRLLVRLIQDQLLHYRSAVGSDRSHQDQRF